MTLKVLDLFAGEGGASKGYLDAGLSLAGAVDLNGRALSRHPVQDVAWQGDWKLGLEIAMDGDWGLVDFIHASPPCQRYAVGTKQSCRENWPDLVDPVREALLKTGLPFVIENVPGSPLADPVYLTGCMFGLTVDWDVPKTKVARGEPGFGQWEVIAGRKWETGPVTDEPVKFHLERKRGFEVHGFSLPVPLVALEVHRLPALPVVGGTPTGFWNQWYAQSIPASVKKQLMRAPWMSGTGVAESIPPAYTEYIGRQFLKSRE
jgi:DNA (cytosine-5)-methyltransferase 1